MASKEESKRSILSENSMNRLIENLKDKRTKHENSMKKRHKFNSLSKKSLKALSRDKKIDFKNINNIWKTNKHLSYFSQGNNFLSRVGDSALKAARYIFKSNIFSPKDLLSPSSFKENKYTINKLCLEDFKIVSELVKGSFGVIKLAKR